MGVTVSFLSSDLLKSWGGGGDGHTWGLARQGWTGGGGGGTVWVSVYVSTRPFRR